MTYKIGFLGPEGTFTQQAAQQLVPDNCELVAYPSIADVLLAADQGDIDGAIAPIENSIEGSVNLTIDFLAHQVDLQIIKELIVPVSHSILVNPGVKLKDIKKIISHPQALAQCRLYLRDNLPGVETENVQSTAKAAEILNREQLQDTAAIATALAAEIYDLNIIAANIQDIANNYTRFVFLAKDHVKMMEYITTTTETWKTSLLITLAKDYPGALYEVLKTFYEQGINLTKIESRPTRKHLGSYHFFIDFYGKTSDSNVQIALANIEESGQNIQVLGSYQILAYKAR